MIDSVELAKRIRVHALRMTSSGGSSHIGSCLSVADILAVLYRDVLDLRPNEPRWPERDRCILSKGHAGAAMYAVLAERGFFPVEWLANHYKNGSTLSGHVSHKGMSGVELSTGALGHGLSIGVGVALAIKNLHPKSRAFVIMSDGECDEGSVWEAAMFASHHRLRNLVAIIDYNKFQSLDRVENTLALEPFAEKWRAFGWKVSEVNGHSHEELRRELVYGDDHRPQCVIAHTIKGKGVSFMEHSVLWHYRTARGKEFDDALRELESE